jgi:stringent starvation protein B
MTSTKPYLIRAFYQWIVDNQLTPFIVIDIAKPHVQVPESYAEEGKIVLNISHEATKDLELGNHYIEFEASFSGEVYQILSPVSAVIAVYAKENGKGMVFHEENELGDGDGEPPPPPPRQIKRKKPALRIVK